MKNNNPARIRHLVQQLQNVSDLRSPAHWWPMAKEMLRRFIMHVGPTNSGKTFSALQRFREYSSGVYCAPLRLLAHEIYHRMNYDWGKPCRLVTGEQIRQSPLIQTNSSIKPLLAKITSFK